MTFDFTVSGKGELAIIGFPETPKLEDLLDDQGCLVVHHCCAAWSDGVLQDNNLEFLNVDKAVHNGSKQKCDFCNRFGASIGCRVPKCMKYYHYPCAAAAGTLQILSDSDMSLLCVDHLAHAKPSEVLCAVCKSMGDCQDQMFCTICGNHYHSKCLQTSINPSPELRAGWQCPDCKQCQTCGMSTNGSKMLVCDSCDKGFHTYCLRPMLSTLPKQSWKCSNCRLCDDCGATVPGPSPTSKWHLNYTLCDQCFNQRNKGEFCPVCCRAHESYVEVAMLSCTSCLRAVHGECETNADSLMQNCRNNYLCPYCRNEVSLVDVILTEEQRELIKNNSSSSIDVECAQSNNSDDNSSGLSTPTEISIKSDDSNGTFSGKPEPREDFSPSIAVKPLHNSYLPPIIHAGKKKSSKPGYPVEKSRPKKKGNGSGVSKRSLGRSNSITALGLPDGDIIKDDEDDATNYYNVVIYSTNDKFVSDQDVCYSCGSFGKNAEGKMIACAQCGQAYHLYCTNLNMSKEGLKKVIESGWRCLDCTVCNSCGNANDEARLLLCDDCDISYHTYCLEPPLDTVPIGGWKCKWCVHCTKCSANTPGTNCNWLSNYTECGPCHSLATCPVCSQGYMDEDLLACCATCQRWLHARCDNMNSESELEWTVSKSYQCILCRPKLKSFGSGGGDGSEREQIWDGVQLSESGAQHIKSINNFVINQFKRRHSTRAATGIGNSRPPRNKSQRSLTDKPDYSYDYSDDEFLSDSEIPPQNDSKRRPKIKSNMGKLLSKPGKQGKLMKSKSSYDGRIAEPLTYESLVSTCETDIQASSVAQETFFGKSLLEMAVKDEKATNCANEGYSTVLDDKKLDKSANDDLLLNEDELNLPVDDFLYDIFLSNDHDQFSALAEDVIPQNSGMPTSNQQPLMNDRSSAIDPAGQNVFTPHTDSSAVEEAVKLRAELSGESNNACSTLPVPSVTSKTLAAPPQSHQQQVLAIPNNNVNCLPTNDSAVLTHANGNQHSVAPPVHHMDSAHSQNSIDTIEIHPRPADSAQFGVYPHHVQNHNTAPSLIDVDGLLNCGGPTGYLNVDSLPQIDSQDVDDILAMGDLDSERPSETPMMQQSTQQQQNQNAPPPPPTKPPSVTMGSNSMQPYQQTSMMNHSANPPPPPPPPPRLQTNTFAVSDWNSTPTPPVKVVPSPVAAAVTNGPKSVAPSESGSSETRESEESKNYKRYEADEHLGENARIAAVLYSIKRHPNLKEDYPDTNARMKQIHKLWRKASQTDKTTIAQMAKDNRAMQRSNKKKKSSPASKEGKIAMTTKTSSNPGPGPSSMDQPLQHVEMVQQLAHQQQFIEQHIQQTGSLSTFPPSNASQLSDAERPIQNFTPSKQQIYSPGKVSNPGSLVDERGTSSQRSGLQQPQSVSADGQNLSDSESGKHRQSVPSSCSEQFNNSPMGDVSGGSFSQQHSPALSQGSMPKNSPFVQSPQMPPPSQRQLSFNEACKVNPSGGSSTNNHSGPPSDASSSVSPAQAQATSNNPSAISPHAAMYRHPPPMAIRQMRPTAVHNTQFYPGPHGAAGYVMQPGTAGGPYYYQGRAYTRWTSPEMMGPGAAAAQWGPTPMHYPGAAGKTYVVRQPMFAHYRGQGPPMGHAQYVHPVQHWPMSARNVSGSPHYAEMFPTGPPQAMRMQPQHYGSPSAAPAVPYQRSNSGVPMPTGPLRSPSSSSAGPHSHAMASPNDKQMMNTTSMDAPVQQKPKTAVPILSEPETFEFDFYQPPSVQNEMGFDRYADEDNSASSRSQSATPGRSSSRQDFANIPSTSSVCDDLVDISLEPIVASSSKESLDFDQLEASFREAVKDRPPGSTAPLMMEGRTLNQAAALAVADVVDQLSANYQAQESNSSTINNSIGGVSSTGSRSGANASHDVAARNSAKMAREDQQMPSGFSSSRSTSQSDKDLINKSKLVSEQPLLIEDLLEQERNELKWNQNATTAVTMHSPSSQSTTANVGSKSSVKSELSPAFPHSEMLQRMAVSNRTNPPMPVFPAQVSPLGQPPMVHMYSPTVIQGAHMSQHRYAANMQLYSPTQIGQKIENPARYGQATGTMVLDPSLQSPIQTSDPMAMSLFSRQMSQPSVTSEAFQDDILTSKLKKAESELETLRRSRKSLTSKQRTLKKSGGDLMESERKALDKFSSDISAKAKEVDSIKKKIRNATESANEVLQNETVQRMQSSSVMGPPQHPSSTSIYQSGKTPSSLTNNNPQSSPRLKRASHSVDISTTGPNSQLVNLIAKNESNQRPPHDASSMTSNENSNQSCFETEYSFITGDLQSTMLEPSAKRRRVKQEDQSSHSSVLSQDHQRMLSNSDQNQFPEAFLDPTTSGEDLATQDTLLSAIKQMQEMKPQEPDLKIEWTLISPKIPWSGEPLESGSLTGQFGKGSIPGRKDYYTAFLNKEPLPSSESPSPSSANSRPSSPSQKSSTNEKKTESTLEKDQSSSSDESRYRTDSGITSASLAEELDDDASVKTELDFLAKIDPAAKRPTGTMSPQLESDWFVQNSLVKVESVETSGTGETVPEVENTEESSLSHKRFLADSAALQAIQNQSVMEISLAVRNTTGHISDIQNLIKRLAQMLCVGPLDDYSLKNLSKENRLQIGNDGVLELHLNGSDVLAPNPAYFNGRDAKIAKRSPNVGASFASKVCTTCKTPLTQNFIVKSINEVIPQQSEELPFCSNDCFFQLAILMKRSQNRHGKGSKNFEGLSLLDFKDLEMKLRPQLEGEPGSNALKTKRWENIRWKRFKKPLTSTSNTSMQTTSQQPSTSAVVETQMLEEQPSTNAIDDAGDIASKQGTPTVLAIATTSTPSHPQNIVLKDEIVKMIDEIDVCLTCDHSLDERKCLFCHQIGDGKPNGPGRLLNYDCDQWVHLNCALWSEEVYETTNGALINVQAAFVRGQEQECSRCGHYGATVACHKTKCPMEYHFPCALLVGCMFFVDKTVLCPQHKYRTKTDTVLENFEALRRVFIHRDEHEIIARVVEQTDRKYTFRCGSTELTNIGQLFPHQMNSFHTPNAIYPVGFKTSRFYWSLDDVNKRCKYNCSIQDQDGKPHFAVSCPKSVLHETELDMRDQLKESKGDESGKREGKNEMELFRGITPKEPWKMIMELVNKLRLSSASSLKLFSEVCSGEEMFGLNDVQILKILESFPSIELCRNYNFKFGRSSLVHLPLAINPSGCCRSEAKLRSYIKRPHVLTSGPKGPRSSIPSLAFNFETEGVAYSKQFVHTKSSQYKRMKQEWRNLCHLSRSRIQGLGMYSSRDVDKGTMIIEYIGLLIRSEVAEVREKQYDRMNRGIYMFRLDDDWVIDATIHGGPARFINHSCDPNCQAELVVFDKAGGVDKKEKRIIITSIRRITKGEELTYDYKIDFENDDKIPCNCGSSICRKWMN